MALFTSCAKRCGPLGLPVSTAMTDKNDWSLRKFGELFPAELFDCPQEVFNTNATLRITKSAKEKLIALRA